MGVKTQMNCHDPYVLTRSEDTRSVSAQSRLIRSVSSWDTLWLVVVVVVVVCSSWEGALAGYNLSLAPNQSDAMLKACQKKFPHRGEDLAMPENSAGLGAKLRLCL